MTDLSTIPIGDLVAELAKRSEINSISLPEDHTGYLGVWKAVPIGKSSSCRGLRNEK